MRFSPARLPPTLDKHVHRTRRRGEVRCSRRPSPDSPYDYDTNTVRVGQHDLARLLLMFRSAIRAQPPGSWAEEEDRIVSGLPDCRAWRREVRLGAERPRGSW
ncbi:hypothetical protein [Streptomyces sp. NPDC003863]